MRPLLTFPNTKDGIARALTIIFHRSITVLSKRPASRPLEASIREREQSDILTSQFLLATQRERGKSVPCSSPCFPTENMKFLEKDVKHKYCYS